jgi:hypothetical protein
VKVPVPAHSLKNVTQFLNQSNNQYKSGPGYVWSKFSNNCVHLSVNQAHAMNISKELKLGQKGIKMLLNMALPANGFLMFADLAVLSKTPSNKMLSKVLPAQGFYRAQVGSIMQAYKAYPAGEIFKTDDLDVLTAPRLLKPLKLLATPRKYQKKYMTPANSELKANAQMWIERYEKLVNDLRPSQKGTIVEEYLFQQLELSKKIASEE